MDIGALSMMIFGFRERELILNFFEKTTGLRMNHNYIRPGGVAADLPDGWQKDIEEILKIIPEKLQDYDDMLLDNPIWKGRLQNVGILTTRRVFCLRRYRTKFKSEWSLLGFEKSSTIFWN